MSTTYRLEVTTDESGYPGGKFLIDLPTNAVGLVRAMRDGLVAAGYDTKLLAINTETTEVN